MLAVVDRPHTSPSVLIVSGTPEDRAGLTAILTESAFAVSQASSVAEANSLLVKTAFDLVIVDDGGAPDLWRTMTGHGVAPILLLAESAGVIERILALELGADAVMTKPVHHRELVSTAKALIRRTRRVLESSTRASDGRATWALDAETRRFTGPGGKAASLSPNELALLRLFLDRPGAPVSAERAAGAVGENSAAARVNFRVTLARLRRRLEQAGYPADAIRTVRGVGYVFLPDEGGDSGAASGVEAALPVRAGGALH